MNKNKSKKEIIISHIFTYFNMLNLALAVLVIISGQYKNMLFMGIVISNTLIGIVQELKVKKLIDQLSLITASKVKRFTKDINDESLGQLYLSRNYEKIQENLEEADIEDLQKGDRIELSIGDQVSADGCVLYSDNIEVDESLLTGEGDAIHKKAGDLLYSGSFVTAGKAVMTVTNTGDENYANRLAAKARTKKRASSQMQDSINKIIKLVSFAIVPIGIALFCIQYFRVGDSISDSLVQTVAGVLGMIPEGLVLLTSISFILGVGRLAKKNALVQEMEAIEALARVNVLCLDKTGTITTGEMKVNSVHQLIPNIDLEVINGIVHDLIFEFDQVNVTAKALRQYFSKPSKEINQVISSIPFSSKRKFMGIMTTKRAYMLGAPQMLTEDEKVLQVADAFSAKGYRTLLLVSSASLKEEVNKDDTRSLALIVLEDCIKEDAHEIFRYFAKRNVEIKVISGDSPLTVSAVAQKAGISKAAHYVDANTLAEDPDKLVEAAKAYTVFGRVSPEKKEALVKAMQKAGMVVGMVGDGVNDVLALKEADCGIAMANGAAAAKQSAHIVLVDSDFSSMKDIVGEGKNTIANIERVSALYLTKTVYSLFLCLVFTIMGQSYPFIPIQLSLIGACAIGIPSFLLTFEKNQDVASRGFLNRVLRISLPGAISLLAALIIIQIIRPIYNFSDIFISTLNTLVGGGVSLGVLIAVCIPFNKKRIAICLGMLAIFVGAIFVMPDFFGIKLF